jgi:hypothetical protein
MPEADVGEHVAMRARTSASVSISGRNRRLSLGFRWRRRPVHPLDNRGMLIAIGGLNPAIGCHFLPKPGSFRGWALAGVPRPHHGIKAFRLRIALNP